MTSYVGHDDVRSAHRMAISKAELAKVNVLRVFLLAEIPEKEKFIKQEAIESEHRHFNDIVQGLYASEKNTQTSSLDRKRFKFLEIPIIL